MSPRIRSGARVWLMPVTEHTQVEPGDIVLARVKGRVYLHFVKAVNQDRFLIANARGRINGWTRTVYGKVTGIEQ